MERGTRAPVGDVSLTRAVLSAAYETHTQLGPGLLESIYEEALCLELEIRGVDFQRQVSVPVMYKGHRLESSFRLDLLVGADTVVEVKAVRALLPVHRAQLLTYLRITGARVGLLLNFHEYHLRNGIVRVVL